MNVLDHVDGYYRQQKDYDVLYKVIIIGETRVGKSAILCKYQFPDRPIPLNLYSTIGIDYRTANFVIDGLRVRVQLWDTAGQEQFRTMTRNYFTGAKGVLLVFDVTDRDSFVLIDDWIWDLKQRKLDNEELFLIGNKIDLDFREVSYEEAANFARSVGMKYFETSAKTGENVKETIEQLVYNIKDGNHPLKKGSIHIIKGEEWQELFDERMGNENVDSPLKQKKSCCY